MKIDEKLWTCTKFSLLFWAEKRMLSWENRGVRRVIRCVLQPENGKFGRPEWKRKPPAPSGAGGAACQKPRRVCRLQAAKKCKPFVGKPSGVFRQSQRSELVAALVLPVHCQLAISGRSTPCAAIYCRCSTSLSRICCTA